MRSAIALTLRLVGCHLLFPHAPRDRGGPGDLLSSDRADDGLRSDDALRLVKDGKPLTKERSVKEGKLLTKESSVIAGAPNLCSATFCMEAWQKGCCGF